MCIASKKMHLIDNSLPLFVIVLCLWDSDGSVFYENGVTDSDLELNKISILTTWMNDTDRQTQTHLLECLKNKSCPVKMIRNEKFTCFCTSDVCAKIQCEGSRESSYLTINCKIELVLANHRDCLVFIVIDDFTHKHVKNYTSTTCGNSVFSFEEMRLQVTELSDFETLATVNFKETDDMKLPELEDGFFDALQNCRNSTNIRAFATMRKSALYLCITGICKNICVIFNCKDGMQCDEVEIAFIIIGTLIFAGIIGLLIGVKCLRHRKKRFQINEEVKSQHYSHDLELTANVNAHSNNGKEVEEENILDLEYNMSAGLNTTDGLVTSSTSRHTDNMDDVYNTYNVLQPNFG